MNIIILGAGEIGLFLAGELSSQDHNVTLLETLSAPAAEAREKLDVRVIEGNGSSVGILEEAGVAECDLFLGLSSCDNTNVVAGSLAKALGAARSIVRVHASVQQEQWLFDYRSRFGLDYLFSIERLAAVELAKFIRNPDSIIVEELAGGRIELQQIEADPASFAAGKTLREMNLPARIRVGSIKREGSIFLPDADERIRPGDIATLFGNPRKLQDVLPLFRKTSEQGEEIRRVVIFGGGEYGFALAQMLENGPFRIRIFERDAKRCEHLARILNNTTLINADATSTRILREEQVGEADFFIGATTDDEDNVMTCIQAKDLGVRHCLSIIHRSDYADIVMRSGDRLGIIGAVSPRVAAKRDLARFLTGEKFTTLLELDSSARIVEFIVKERGRLAGHTISQIEWPKGSGLVALTHGSTSVVPAASDALHPGDSVVALVSNESIRAFSRLIG